MGEKSIRQIIGIAAGKGGVGKSTLTVNLALALTAMGFKVGILDADLYGPSIRTMLPLDNLLSQEGEKLTPALSHGIAYISLALFKKQGGASVIRAPIANRLIAQFLGQVEWGELDYLLIDFPPGTGDIQITLSQQALLSGALIVTTPQEIALQDVRKCIDMFLQVHIPLLGIVENMSYYQSKEEKVYLFGKGGGDKLAKESGIPLLGQIPLDPLIGTCLDQGKSLFQEQDGHELKECFIHLARELDASLNSAKKSLSIVSVEQKEGLTIKWSDGLTREFLPSQLQKMCPCAGCQTKSPLVDEKVQALVVRTIGRYAIKVDFNSGCSHGIYDFDLLRGLNR